jgi:2-polyprenyl-3-methyl-5-hydroxy-6-metoxy-1,4-benzoquinol methylase/glycosyltransferase involved in cell wall biosynthesis
MPTLSVCLIARDAADQLDVCLKSLVGHAQEIIVVDTGSLDNTKEVAARNGAKVFDYNPSTNPSSFIRDDETTKAPPPYTGDWILADFCGARNFSFEKATQDYILWVDSDDTFEGASELPGILQDMEANKIEAGWLLYNYSFNDEGKPNCQLWRERIVRRGINAKWHNAIHELILLPSTTRVQYYYNALVVHHRDHAAAKSRRIAHRNYKVLRRVFEQEEKKGDFDARTLFYLGNETRFLNLQESASYYERYLKLSGWPMERAVARILLGQIYEAVGEREAAFKSYASAVVDDLSNPDGWLALGRLSYFKEEWQRSVEYYERGLSLGNPTSAIMYNPLERTYYPHEFYNVALNKVGRVKDALASCDAGLAVNPNNTNLQFNKKLYEEHLTKNPEAPRAVERCLNLSRDSIMDTPPNTPPDVLVMTSINIWKELLRYDEVCKARDFLQSLPYPIQGDELICRAIAKTDDLLRFTKSKESLRAYYSTHAVNEAMSLDHELTSDWGYSQYVRWKVIKEYMPNGKQRVLDLGCQDGWVSNRLAKMGHSVVGVDFSRGHLDIARRNAAKYRLDATFVEGFIEDLSTLTDEKFDVILCTEVIEHVDDYNHLLKSLYDVLRPGGVLILTTPRGAWLQGKAGDFSWAYKWNEPREHIRAWTPDSLRLAASKYFEVQSVSTRPIPTKPDVDNQATLAVRAVRKDPTVRAVVSEYPLDIVFYIGQSLEWWSPDSTKDTGIGGSETAAICMARELVKLGHRVRVFNDCPNLDGLYDGVEYHHYGMFNPSVTCDVLIVSRAPWASEVPIKARSKYLWVHDIHCGPYNPKMHQDLLRFDRFLCLSEWHKHQSFLPTYPDIYPNSVIVTRNGIDVDRFVGGDRLLRENKLIFSSSPNRGLDALLDVLPEIRALVPGTELHVYYGFFNWEKFAKMRGDPMELQDIERYRQRIKSAEGVVWHDRVNQKELAGAFMSSKVWAYPTMFPETSCISAMEAQCAGCVPVTTRIAALAETVKVGTLLDPPTGPAYMNQFVREVCDLLIHDYKRIPLLREARAHGLTLGWDKVAKEWDHIFQSTLKHLAYYPAPSFHERFE